MLKSRRIPKKKMYTKRKEKKCRLLTIFCVVRSTSPWRLGLVTKALLTYVPYFLIFNIDSLEKLITLIIILFLFILHETLHTQRGIERE